MVCAPVGHLAAGVFVPPAVGVVAAFGDIVHQRARPQPHIPVQPRRDWGDAEGAAWVAADATLDAADLADAAVADQLSGQAEAAVVLGALLAAGLQDAAGLPGYPHQLLALVDRQGQRLLQVHVLAASHRLDGDEGVPVVGGGDGDGLDVAVLQQAAVVLEPAHFPEAVHPHLLAGTVEVAAVHVAGGDVLDVPTEGAGLVVDAQTAALRRADADGGHVDAVVGAGWRVVVLLLCFEDFAGKPGW
jgi:hypothetical protein